VANLVLLLLCFALGLAARRSGAFPADSHKAVTAWVLWVSLPALVFRSIHGVALERTLVLGAGLLWLVFLVPAVIAVLLLRRDPARARGELGATVLCSGLCNTAFVGLPLLEALGGKDVLGPAVVVDQLGAFLALFLFALPFATWLEAGTVSFRASLKKLGRSPALWALGLALATRSIDVPPAADTVLARLADMLSPLAIATIGWQLDLRALQGNGRRLLLGLTWKLVLAPAVVLGVLLLWRGHLGITERVILAQAAMAPMVTAGVVATEHKLAPSLAAAFIALGVPLSLVTVSAWWQLSG